MLRLTEFYTAEAAPEGDLPGAVARTTIAPGLIDDDYARWIMGDDFDRALRLGVLVRVKEGRPCPA